MVRIKICGITNQEDASLAVDLGVNGLGFIFAKSPRSISPEKTREIISNVPPFVSCVGVFVDEDPVVIREITEFCRLDYIQLHGNEPPDICLGLMPRSIKALRVKDESAINLAKAYRKEVRALLLDTYSKDKAGGTGKPFDWNIALKVKQIGVPVILAGGLEPDNIEEAISFVKPYAVDINSGIEKSPGKKDHALMRDLMQKIRMLNMSWKAGISE